MRVFFGQLLEFVLVGVQKGLFFLAFCYFGFNNQRRIVELLADEVEDVLFFPFQLTFLGFIVEDKLYPVIFCDYRFAFGEGNNDGIFALGPHFIRYFIPGRIKLFGTEGVHRTLNLYGIFLFTGICLTFLAGLAVLADGDGFELGEVAGYGQGSSA
jgi:hypothetical protein